MMRHKCPALLLALVSSLLVPVTQAEALPAPIKAIEARGATVVGEFTAPGGLRGYAARYNGQGLALYLTADGQHVLVGTLFDAQGEDLTSAPLNRLVYEPMAKEMWARMEGSTWIADGNKNAARIVYLFDDPNCPYCNQFWHQARPWIESGRVQLRHIMVGLLSSDSAGKAAALLTAKQPEVALMEHETAGDKSMLKALDKVPTKVQEQLDANLALMSELGAVATPAIFYRDDDGRLKMQQGLPQAQGLAEIMGPK
ncbi:thiol:disulfide interchange protein DsbG [Pseudomonas sp. TCU-HL1]|uniref:thiol:disulfide interchange protein DsbG n=1 Tax=Pseudomonas sp. TCU-HL1 TaxID=1856685 RepID=UPI00083D6009|nr:thiol:disulfide interchange protein DsbG [Pseudomonas sp. TCU-HL1]AOE85113.1 dihydroneopterin aldolase [Pseudomonas sp. TCU-HL1]